MELTKTSAGTNKNQLTWSREAFDLIGLEELSLAEGIVSTEETLGGREAWRKGFCGARLTQKGGKGKRQGASATAFSILLYSPPSNPAFKFWTHETTYALERLLEPTTSPQTEWG